MKDELQLFFLNRFPSLALLTVAALTAAIGTGCGSREDTPAPAPAPPAASVKIAAPAPAPASLTAAQVRAQLVEAIRTQPDDPRTNLELALFDLRAKDLHNAESGLLACWRKFPRFARAPYHLGLLYLTHGHNEDALAPLRKAAALAKDDPEVQESAGLATFRAGYREEAMRYVQAALRLDSKRPAPYMLLARLYDQHGTAQMAIESLQNYLKYSPDSAPGYFLIGRMYARQADRANAELWLRRAVEASPNNAEFWVTLGRVYCDLFYTTRAQEGIQCYEKALAIEPDRWDAHLYLGEALMKARRWEEAATHFQRAVQTSPQPGSIYYSLGQALIKAGHKEEGERALARNKAYREFTDGANRLSKAMDVAPQDRSRRYAFIRFCLSSHQPTAALTAIHEAEDKLGSDATLKQLQAEAENLLMEAQAHSAPASSGLAAPATSGGALDPNASPFSPAGGNTLLPFSGGSGNGR